MPASEPTAEFTCRVARGSAAHRHPASATKAFSYGTAGFRTAAETLDGVMYRVGVVAALRSMSHKGRAVGVMVTASHNPHQDNGVKLVEPMGEMLEEKWEEYAVKLANANSDEMLSEEALKIAKAEGIDLKCKSKVVVARDTRPSGEGFVGAIIDGVRAAGGEELNFGLLTTPQLHFITRCLNDASYGSPTESGYLSKLTGAFKSVLAGKKIPGVVVDCANGVGALKMKPFCDALKDIVEISLVNTNTDAPEKLNHQCGADFVKTNGKSPFGVNLKPGILYASFDGDGDRIVFYSANAASSDFFLLDGDRIAVLLTVALKKILFSSGSNLPQSDTKIGIVQTAYANGASMSYIRNNMGVENSIACTGVKHLHHAALCFDIGVYFEANGHGTVLIGDSVGARLSKVLGAWRDLINETVGDAVSDLLLVLAALNALEMNAEKWLAMYTDLPSQLVRVVVNNRSLFKTIDADTKLVAPEGLQALIDEEVKKHRMGRCFVRPSGTEDVVRVYAEAENEEACKTLANKVAGIVFDKAGGKGQRPAEFL